MDIVFSCGCRSWAGEKRGVIIKEIKKVVHEKVLKQLYFKIQYYLQNEPLETKVFG